MEPRMRSRHHHLLAALMALGIVTSVSSAHGQASSVSPAALLTFPYLTIDGDRGIDTVVQITNTGDAPVEVRCVLEETTPACVNGAGTCLTTGTDVGTCTGICEPIHTATTFRLRLTRQQPIGWTLSDGLSIGPIAGTGGTTADGASDLGTQVPAVTHDPFVGLLRCVAVDDYGMPAERNVLTGTASIETFDGATAHVDAASYNAIGITHCPASTSPPTTGSPSAERIRNMPPVRHC